MCARRGEEPVSRARRPDGSSTSAKVKSRKREAICVSSG